MQPSTTLTTTSFCTQQSVRRVQCGISFERGHLVGEVRALGGRKLLLHIREPPFGGGGVKRRQGAERNIKRRGPDLTITYGGYTLLAGPRLSSRPRKWPAGRYETLLLRTVSKLEKLDNSSRSESRTKPLPPHQSAYLGTKLAASSARISIFADMNGQGGGPKEQS